MTNRMNQTTVDKRLLWPVLAGFFITGFCDMVAPVTQLIGGEFPEQQRAVSYLPTMVFLWFLLLSIPLVGVMNRTGRKRMAQIGYLFTFVGLLLPYFLAGEGCALTGYFVGFALLGVGNTAIQVAINPLLATIAPSDRMTSYLTVGQIFRNFALMLVAPLAAFVVSLTGNWYLLLPLYAAVTLLGALWLEYTPIVELPHAEVHGTGFMDCLSLLRNRCVLICTLGIACFIAADVAIGYVSVRLTGHENSLLATTGFYALRIVGTLVGAWVLIRVRDVKYLFWNMLLAGILCLVLFFVRGEAVIYALVGALGFSMACVFATFYAVATHNASGRENEVAGLMILAISAGALSGPICGALIRWAGVPQAGLLFVAACLLYLLVASRLLWKKTNKQQLQ